jgi:hypothetical protein
MILITQYKYGIVIRKDNKVIAILTGKHKINALLIALHHNKRYTLIIEFDTIVTWQRVYSYRMIK